MGFHMVMDAQVEGAGEHLMFARLNRISILE